MIEQTLTELFHSSDGFMVMSMSEMLTMSLDGQHGHHADGHRGPSPLLVASEGKAVIEQTLTELFHSSDGFMVMSMSEMLDTMTSMVNMVIMVLTVIAGISLLVGGIGIMNIMMVSVTERTREIGIRKALGAKERYILALFVIEASMTSALGGVIGIVLGYLVSAAANQVLPLLLTDMDLTISPSPSSVAVAFGISAGIGILFGYLPAKRAARLNPIDALRYD